MQELENNQVENREVSNEISMREYFSACGAYWKWFVLSFVVCAAIAVLFKKSSAEKI